MRSPIRSPRVSSRVAARAGDNDGDRDEAGSGLVGKVGSDDGGSIVVIASVEDQADCVPHPLAWLYGAKFVEQQHLGLKHGPQHLKLRCLDRIVIGVLNLLEELAIVTKEARASTGNNEFLQQAYGEMSFAGSDSADQEYAGAIARVKLLQEARGGDMGKLHGAIGSGKIRRKI